MKLLRVVCGAALMASYVPTVWAQPVTRSAVPQPPSWWGADPPPSLPTDATRPLAPPPWWSANAPAPPPASASPAPVAPSSSPSPRPAPSAPAVPAPQPPTLAEHAPATPAGVPPPPVLVERQSRAERVIYELGGGLLTTAGGGVLGLLLGNVGAAFGATAGAALGVYLVGDNTHGNGGLGWTLLGSVTGGAAALVVMQSGVSTPLAVMAVGLLPLTGAILGYELTSDADARTRRAAQARLVPVATATADGALLGVTGMF